MHFDDLTDQLGITHAHHVKHIGFPHPLGNDQRTGNLEYSSFNHLQLHAPARDRGSLSRAHVGALSVCQPEEVSGPVFAGRIFRQAIL